MDTTKNMGTMGTTENMGSGITVSTISSRHVELDIHDCSTISSMSIQIQAPPPKKKNHNGKSNVLHGQYNWGYLNAKQKMELIKIYVAVLSLAKICVIEVYVSHSMQLNMKYFLKLG